MTDLIKFKTQAAAQRAQQTLLSHGVSARLRRDPDPDRRVGCGFALYVPDIALARSLLQAAGLLPRGGDKG
ncbi:MAG: hypothetical protein IKN72_03250 [Clostridia bacterium]|nr:hypothetical protein [Clostridia bacterium]MBR3552386.1 hypothetical protein [Clostridia bacterium]